MFFIFGWSRERKEAGPGLSCWCYRCMADRNWEHWKDVEWVSFFMVRTIPLISKSHLVCSRCREAVRLDGTRSRLLGNRQRREQVAQFLEEHQLAQKTEVQRRYLMSKRDQGRTCN